MEGKGVKMTDYDKLRLEYRSEQTSIIELMNAMYYAKSISETNSLKREIQKRTKIIALKKEQMLIIDNINAGGI